MREPDRAAALVDRIVAGARIPSRAARDDLRRELLAHFEDAALSGEGDALRRFGEDAVRDLLRRVYRRDYITAYALKIVASVAVSAAVALAIETAANLRIPTAGDGWSLAPPFAFTALLATGMVATVVIVREATMIRAGAVRAAVAIAACSAVCGGVVALSRGGVGVWIVAASAAVVAALCSTYELRPSRVVVVFASFAAAEYAMHVVRSVAFPPTRALAAGAILTTVWGATVLVLGRIDHAFSRWLDVA